MNVRFLGMYQGNSDYKDYFMNDSVVNATITTVFDRIPKELPITTIGLPLTFLCTVFDENEVSDWFEPKFAVAAINAVERFEWGSCLFP
jgi:hypothetical protein